MACGTYRSHRTGFPPELTDKQNLKGLNRGDSMMRHKGQNTVIAWMDKKKQYMLLLMNIYQL